MARNERLTCKEVIEPALSAAGWTWQEQLVIVKRLRFVRAVAESLQKELVLPSIEQLRSAVLRKAFLGEL